VISEGGMALKHNQHTVFAPDFRLPDMNGIMHSLSSFLGKKVFLVSWASW